MRSTALIAGLALALAVPASAQPAPPPPITPEAIGDEFNGAELSSD